MEEPEQTSRLFSLSEEAQEALQKACEVSGVQYYDFQVAVGNLYALCVHTVEQIREAFELLRNAAAESAAPAVKALVKEFESMYSPDELFFMVTPHIKHLAYNHPKARVRNKNWNRMWKIRERYMKWHKD